MNNRFAFLDMDVSNDLLGDTAALRERFDRDSYLYFRGVLDTERVRDVRRAILGITQRLGWTEPGAFPMSQRCIVTPLREEDDEFISGYQEIQKLQAFHELSAFALFAATTSLPREQELALSRDVTDRLKRIRL